MTPALLLAAGLSFAQDAKPAEIRCSLVDRPHSALDAAERAEPGMLSRATLVRMKDGAFIAAFERTSQGGEVLGLTLSRSTDQGAHWLRVKTFGDLGGGSLFEDSGALYLIGSVGGRNTGWPVIYRSSDHGESWSTPRNALTGRVIGGVTVEACASPALKAGGRVWKAFIRPGVETAAAPCDQALVASAELGADLLLSDSWRWSRPLSLEGSGSAGWEQSRLVADADAPPCLMLFSHKEAKWTASLSTKGWVLEKRDPQPAWVGCGALDARLERDAASWHYFALAALPDSSRAPVPPASMSSQLSLLDSRDLTGWEVRTVLLRGEPSASWTCADWAIDGEDLVVVVGGALSEGEDSRALLFVRVPKFRERKVGDLPATASALGR